MNADGIRYVVTYKDSTALELVHSTEAVQKWPIEVINYLQSNIKFEMPLQSAQFANGIEVNQTAAVGEPAHILGKNLNIVIFCFSHFI